jgi:hypothetical protein
VRIIGVGRTGMDWASADARANTPTAASEESVEPGRALILHASATARPSTRHPDVHSLAAFLAQLIATARRAPQTRERRRGTIQEAVTGYATAAAAPKRRATVSKSV